MIIYATSLFIHCGSEKSEKSILKKLLEYCYPVPYPAIFGGIYCAAGESGEGSAVALPSGVQRGRPRKY